MPEYMHHLCKKCWKQHTPEDTGLELSPCPHKGCNHPAERKVNTKIADGIAILRCGSKDKLSKFEEILHRPRSS